MQDPQTNQGFKKTNAEDDARRKNEQELVKASILKQTLDQAALARLSNLSAAKPEKAQAIENMIINMARMGQIRGKMTDEGLKGLLDKISEKTTKTTTVKFNRRRVDSDDEDEW